MSNGISPVEKALLRGKWTGPIDNPTAELAEAALTGNFRQVLTSPTAKRLLCVNSPTFSQPFDEAFPFPSTLDNEKADETQRLIVAVACLHAFVQVNWTGPDLDVKPSDIISISSQNSDGAFETSSNITEEFLNEKAISELAIAGEPAYPLTKVAAFLRSAQVLLAVPYKRCLSALWWRLRVAKVHQQILDEPAPVPESLITSLDPLTAYFEREPDLAGQLILEQGLLEHQFAHDRPAAEFFVRAAKATGMQFELTGALGKRTKFQQTALSQLVLLAQSSLKSEDTLPPGETSSPGPNSDTNSSTEKPSIPETLALNDDTLLERTEFTSSNPTSDTSLLAHINPSIQPPLHPIDQCILLAMCINVKNTSPSHGLTIEQMSPYVERVITHPRNWSIHTMALLLRARLESTRTRTAERSTLQLQALIDQMPTTDSTLQERLLYFHSIPLPSKWELERELAHRFLGLGVVKSALETFERLEMWEEVVRCYAALEKADKAIAIVRDLLEGRKAETEEVISRGKMVSADRRSLHDNAREAKLWCLLGDLEPDHAVEHYERAWMISKGTSGRAMRSLGGYYFGRGRFKEAITALKRAVAINPLLSKTWFILGCACLRLEDWEEAKTAFIRCVSIDEDDAESWNNLANVYLRMGTGPSGTKNSEDDEVGSVTNGNADKTVISFDHKLLAFRALKQGLRFSYENWRMWYNYMVVSIDVGELFEACRALGRIVEETGDKVGVKAVDEDVLERLVNAATHPAGDTSQPSSVENSNEGLARSVTDLIERIILPRASSPRIFRAYARLLTSKGQWNETIKAYLDAYRCGTAGTMKKGEPDVEKWQEAVVEVEEIVDVLKNFGSHVDGYNWRLQARSLVKTFMGRTRDFEEEPEWERLKTLEEELRAKVEGVIGD